MTNPTDLARRINRWGFELNAWQTDGKVCWSETDLIESWGIDTMPDERAVWRGVVPAMTERGAFLYELAQRINGPFDARYLYRSVVYLSRHEHAHIALALAAMQAVEEP